MLHVKITVVCLTKMAHIHVQSFTYVKITTDVTNDVVMKLPVYTMSIFIARARLNVTKIYV